MLTNSIDTLCNANAFCVILAPSIPSRSHFLPFGFLWVYCFRQSHCYVFWVSNISLQERMTPQTSVKSLKKFRRSADLFITDYRLESFAPADIPSSTHHIQINTYLFAPLFILYHFPVVHSRCSPARCSCTGTGNLLGCGLRYRYRTIMRKSHCRTLYSLRRKTNWCSILDLW